MRRALRHTVLALAAACALGASAPAKADPVTIVTLAAYAASGAGIIAATTAAYIAFGVAIVGGIAARRKAKRAAAAAKDARIASMADRCVTMMTSEPEPNVIYGRCPVGGWVIDKITTPKTYVDDAGTVRTKPDALQHIVIGIACHEVEAIHDVFMYGDWIGTIGADGWVTGGPADAPYGTLHAVQGSRPVTFVNGSATLEQPQQGYSVSKLISISQDGGSEHAGATLAGRTITGGPSSGQWTVTYEISRIKSSLRVEFFRGAPGQTASAYLMSVAPGVWTAAHRLQGIAGAIVTFDLDDGRHQGIPSDLAFDVSGRKVYDPRTGLAAWSRNAALCTYDWMRASWGLRLTTDDVADVVAVANICDQQVSLTIGGVTAVGARYTLDGAFGVNADKSSTLADMLETMGGFAAHGAQWSIHAGAWTEPVMALTDDDLASPIRVVRSHTPLDERMNAAKASYMPERKTKPSDADPYINAAFVAADGGREWGSFTLPFTNNKARARNLLRQFVEQSRAGMIIQYTGKMRLWPLQVGDRVTVTSSRFGLVADTFRVIDWSWAPGQPVALTLQRDIAASYDDADASTADPAPATRLPNPGLVDTPTGLAAASGTEHLLKMSDGTIVPRVLVSWAAPQTIYMSDPSARTRVAWRRMAESTWNDLPALAGNTTSGYLDTVRDRDMIVIRVQHVNSFGAASTWVAMAHSVVGKTAAPSAVSGLAAASVTGGVRVSWTPCQDIDYDATEIRIGLSWSSATRVVRARTDQYLWSWPSPGVFQIWAAHLDTSGNYSVPVSIPVTVDSAAWPNGVNLCWQKTSFSAAAGTYGEVIYLKTQGDNGHALQPGEWLTVSGDLSQDAVSASAGQTASVFVFAADANGAWKAAGSISSASTVAHRFTASVQLPTAAADMVAVGVGLYHQPAGPIGYPGTVWADRVQVERGRLATEFSPGAQPGATKNLVYQQPAQPAAGHVGDIWVDTDDGNKLYLHDGTSWVARRDASIDAALQAAAAAKDTADGKIDTFYQPTAPAAGTLGDLWIDTDDANKLYRHNGTGWALATDTRVGQALADAATAQATADGKVTTYFGSATPIGADLGDLWYNDASQLLSRWSGATWIVVSNAYTNTSQLVDGANLGGTATMLGQASNMINCQTEFANNSTAGWAMGSWVAGMPTLFQGAELSRDPAGNWVPAGGNAICLAQGAPATSANSFVWGGQYPGGNATFAVAQTESWVPVQPLTRVCVSAWVAHHRCGVDLYAEFKRSDGVGTGGGMSTSATEVGGGKSLAGWRRLAVFAEVPADAVAMRLTFAKRNTDVGQSNSYAWMSMPMIERAGSLQTEPSAYSPSAATSHAQLGLIGTGDVADGAATDMLFSHNIGPINVNGYFSSYEIAFINYIVKKTSCPANIRCSFVYELTAPAGFNRSLGPAASIDVRGAGYSVSVRPVEVGTGSIEYTFPHIIDFPVGVQARCAAGISVIAGASIKITDVVLTIEAVKL